MEGGKREAFLSYFTLHSSGYHTADLMRTVGHGYLTFSFSSLYWMDLLMEYMALFMAIEKRWK